MKKTALKRRTNSERKADRELRKRLAQAFHRAVTRGSCVMCANQVLAPEVKRDFAADLRKREAHHVLSKEDLKRERGLTELDDLMWAPDNGVCLCSYHHQRHEKYVERFTRRLVPKAAVLFAATLDLSWLLDREYPDETPPCDHCGAAESKWTGASWLCADCEHDFRSFDAA